VSAFLELKVIRSRF